MPTDFPARFAAVRALVEKMTPAGEWGLSQRGDTIIRGDTDDRQTRHPQTHLQMVPPEDAQGVVALVNLFPEIVEELERREQWGRRLAECEVALETAERELGLLRAELERKTEAYRKATIDLLAGAQIVRGKVQHMGGLFANDRRVRRGWTDWEAVEASPRLVAVARVCEPPRNWRAPRTPAGGSRHA